CDIVGDYSFPAPRFTVYFRFGADGTWVSATDRGFLDFSTFSGTYTISGAQIAVHDGPTAVCAPALEGVYAMTWATDCSEFRLTVVSEPCTARATTLGGVMMTRL